MKHPFVAIACLFACTATGAYAQSWTPQKNVEIVVGSAPGGSNDKTARTVERILTMNKLIPSTLTVVNKPGGGSNIAFTYVAQHAGDPHYLMVGTPSLLTNNITTLLSNVISLIGSLVIVFLLNSRLVGFVLVLALVIVGIAVFFGRYFQKFSTRVQDALANATVAAEEGLQGVRIVEQARDPFAAILPGRGQLSATVL